MDPKPAVLTVEPVTPETAATAYELLCEFVASIGKESEFSITEEQFRSAITRQAPLFEVIIAKYRGEVAGYGEFYPVYDSWTDTLSLHVTAVYVRPAFRPRYLAPAIYFYLAGLAKERGYASMHGFVPRANKALQHVYRNAGAGTTDYVLCLLPLEKINHEVLNQFLRR